MYDDPPFRTQVKLVGRREGEKAKVKRETAAGNLYRLSGGTGCFSCYDTKTRAYLSTRVALPAVEPVIDCLSSNITQAYVP
eukprot:scaffold8758_cov154-Skeletonema_menzelii.AAC.2